MTPIVPQPNASSEPPEASDAPETETPAGAGDSQTVDEDGGTGARRWQEILDRSASGAGGSSPAWAGPPEEEADSAGTVRTEGGAASGPDAAPGEDPAPGETVAPGADAAPGAAAGEDRPDLRAKEPESGTRPARGVPVVETGGPERRDGDRRPAPAADRAPPEAGRARVEASSWTDPLEDELELLREEARRLAREDAELGIPEEDTSDPGISEAERTLRERCRGTFERWRNRILGEHRERLAKAEEAVAEKLSQVGLGIDKFERLTSELVRLKARVAMKRREVSREIEAKRSAGQSGLSTRMYVAALVFLGLVEFFANAPVFSALLPRDPLTERQIQLISETSEGWMAGAQRVFAHIALRPDAALLAAGIVTFLCVLAHFFGHSLRDLIIKRDREVRREAVESRTPMENVVPMVLTGVGLALVLGVLYEARITLGEVGERQFGQDIAQVEELRREASWLRSDGDLLAANERQNRADDMQAAAEDLREYAASMSRMSFPILLLNLTLVLCAMSAAYFHRTDTYSEYFTEQPFEEERRELLERGEGTADAISRMLADAVRGIRELRGHAHTRPLAEAGSLGSRLESVVSTYRRENARARELDSRSIGAFREPLDLGLEVESDRTLAETVRDPDDYERERSRLADRFEEVRRRFNDEVVSQDALASRA